MPAEAPRALAEVAQFESVRAVVKHGSKGGWSGTMVLAARVLTEMALAARALASELVLAAGALTIAAPDEA